MSTFSVSQYALVSYSIEVHLLRELTDSKLIPNPKNIPTMDNLHNEFSDATKFSVLGLRRKKQLGCSV